MKSLIRFVFYLLLSQQVLSKAIQNALSITNKENKYIYDGAPDIIEDPINEISPSDDETILNINDETTISDYNDVAKRYKGVIICVGYYNKNDKNNIYNVGSSVFNTHYKNFKNKINIGYYFKVRANTTNDEIINYVDKVHNVIKNKQNNFPVYIYMGSGFNDKIKENTELAKTAINELKNLKYKTGFYTSDGTESFDLGEIKKDGTSLMIAYYGRDNGKLNKDFKPRYEYDIWEYTGNGYDEKIDNGSDTVSKSILEKEEIIINPVSKSGSQPWTYIIIGGGILSLIGLILGFIFYNKSKNNDKKSESSENSIDVTNNNLHNRRVSLKDNGLYDASPPPYDVVLQENIIQYIARSRQRNNYTQSSSIDLLSKTNPSLEQYNNEIDKYISSIPSITGNPNSPNPTENLEELFN